MTSFNDLMKSIAPSGNGAFTATTPPDWMQGRTIYGGLSAALCLAAVRKAFADLPPLRSAQISFIGPAGGTVEMTPSLLRQGKSVTFASADIIGEKGLATRAGFCFGAARESKFDLSFIGEPNVPLPDESKSFFEADAKPHFANNFDVRLAKGGSPCSGSNENDHYLWVRYKEPPQMDDASMLALADMPPPAMMPMFTEFAPISSMTWLLNFLHETPQTEDNWWLLQSRAEHAREGYSSQDMIVWNTYGQAVIAGRQNVAIFA